MPQASTQDRQTDKHEPQLGATRIQSQIGAISATVSGQLGSQGSRFYVLRASAVQVMELAVGSSTGGVSFTIWREDAVVLKQHAENRTKCLLPLSQDYYVALYINGQTMSYHLTVMIGPRESSALW